MAKPKKAYQLTKTQRVFEIKKAGRNPNYFINTYAKITHPIKGIIPFHMYDYQDKLVDAFADHRFNIVLKARQLGISTIVAGYIAWLMVFHRNKEVVVLATKLKAAKNLLRKTKYIIKKLPSWLQLSKIAVDNQESFELDNGSLAQATATSGDAGRSDALSLLVLDEAAHIDKLDEIWTAIYPTISTGGNCIALSTPNGVGNWFHKIYDGAENGHNEFKTHKLMWWEHPDRDDEWFKKETQNMTRREIAQEHECNFNMSGETVFDPEDLEKLATQIKAPIWKTGFDRNFWIWEKYNNDHSYLISADVARGDGQDYSTFHLFDATSMEIVGEYQGKLTPDYFAHVLNDAGRDYGNCMIVVENNTIGFSVLEKLIDWKYPNLFWSVKSTHEYIEQYEAEQKSNTVAGFTMSQKTRPLVIAKMEEFIRNKIIKIYSSRLLAEMKTFVWDNGKPQAMRMYFDDLIMACAIGCWIKDTVLEVDKRDLDYKKAFLNAMTISKSTMNTSIGGLSNANAENRDRARAQQREYAWFYKG